jgi:hypothetical protein
LYAAIADRNLSQLKSLFDSGSAVDWNQPLAEDETKVMHTPSSLFL